MLQGDRNILLLVLFTVVIFIGVFLPSAQGAEPSSNKKEKVIIDCPGNFDNRQFLKSELR